MIEQLLIAEAERYIGTKEVGVNRGIRVDYWNFEAIGDWRKFPMGGQGAPWCMTFVSQMGVQALGRSRWPVPILSSVQALVDWADGRQITSPLPHPGDLFALWYPRQDRFGHVGIVTALSADNHFRTIEGNTNAGGSRTGNAVMPHNRPVTARCKFIRWAETV